MTTAMESSQLTPPPSADNKTFNEVTTQQPDMRALVTFQRIDNVATAPNKGTMSGATAGPTSGSKIGTVSLAVLYQKCGIGEDVRLKDVSMATVKEGMIKIGLAKEFDIWSSPISKLLDYDLNFMDYLDHVSTVLKESELDMRVFYGLKKDHDQQTVQEVYKSGNFVIKLVEVRSGKPQGVGSIRVMKSLPDGASNDILDPARLRSRTLGDFRDKITPM